MQRFYIKDLKVVEDSFTLRDVNIVYQLVKVLRARIGDNVILFDGIRNIDYLCEIIDFSKKEIQLKFIEKIDKQSELNFEINLIQAFPNKLDKIEYILQKGVEVGVKHFTFFRSDRSQKLSISEKKKERLEKIIVEAAEQSGRNHIPELVYLEEKSGFEIESFNVASIYLHTNDKNSQSIKDYIPVKSDKKILKLNIFVGPEGGFSDDETTNFDEKKFSKVHLGNRILRTETAGVVTAFTLGQML